MKKRLAAIGTGIFIATLLIFTAGHGVACVGRTLYIGSTGTLEDELMAEMLVTLINERTGTTVQLRSFPNQAAMYKAMQSDDEKTRADIIVENTVNGMKRLNLKISGDQQKDFIAAKDAYEKAKDLNLIWMAPFGYHIAGKSGTGLSAAVIRHDVLTNFPLLPRVLKKLAGAIDDSRFKRMINKVKHGKKPRNVAKDFLMRKKII